MSCSLGLHEARFGFLSPPSLPTPMGLKLLLKSKHLGHLQNVISWVFRGRDGEKPSGDSATSCGGGRQAAFSQGPSSHSLSTGCGRAREAMSPRAQDPVLHLQRPPQPSRTSNSTCPRATHESPPRSPLALLPVTKPDATALSCSNIQQAGSGRRGCGQLPTPPSRALALGGPLILPMRRQDQTTVQTCTHSRRRRRSSTSHLMRTATLRLVLSPPFSKCESRGLEKIHNRQRHGAGEAWFGAQTLADAAAKWRLPVSADDEMQS